MKPSEQFADLKSAVDQMEDGKDKEDLLALFSLADSLHDRVSKFDKVTKVTRAMTRAITNQYLRELEEIRETNRKWELILHYFDYEKEEKVAGGTVLALKPRREVG